MRDTIDMAREAGIIDFRDAYSEEHVQAVLEDLKAFADLVRADEREACARLADQLTWADNKGVASAIQARSGDQK